MKITMKMKLKQISEQENKLEKIHQNELNKWIKIYIYIYIYTKTPNTWAFKHTV